MLPDNDFGNVKPAEIHGTKWVDLDGDGRAEVVWGSYDLVALEGAVHVPLAWLESCWNALEAYKGKTLIAYCHHGMRSQSAAEHFRQQGFTNVHNLTGGIVAIHRGFKF